MNPNPRARRPTDLARAFAHAGVARAYAHRPPYPAEVLDILERLIVGHPRNVLDIGAGEGALAHPLAPRVDHVDAVDISAAMINAGRGRPGGGQPNLRWIVGPAEAVELGGPYALVTAGASLHWMPWQETLPRLVDVMTDHAVLAVAEHGYDQVPWRTELREVIQRHSRNPDYEPNFSVADEVSARGLYRIYGRTTTSPVAFKQSVASYVEQFHSTATLARELMSTEDANAFDDAIKTIVRPHAVGDRLTMHVVASVAWGRPITPT